ncbi:hypothetical protein BJ170DRAFT_156515 [Xylariales sp. AK1849]|nr:hypothetical protein BJ170DRAFT_156515 [Xylariales sp. AK1849]
MAELQALEGSGPKLLPASTLHCPLCQKPFIQESSHKRHTSYCRKAQDRQRIRKKACRACSSAKTKCTFERTCRRCRSLSLHCSYDQPGTTVEVTRRPQPLVPTGVPDNSSIAPANPIARNEVHFPDASRTDIDYQLPDFHIVGDTDPIRPASTNHGILVNIPGRVEDLGSALETQMTVPIWPSYQTSLPPSFLHLPREPMLRSALPCNANNNHISAPFDKRIESGIPLHVRQKWSELARLQPTDPVAQHNLRLIYHTMRAYPYMMLRRETFPPFIHPHWHRQSTPALPWPLANCMSIAKLFVSRTSETVAFLWQTVKSESQRCLDEMNDFSDECLLAATQVQIMYLIMRLIDGATQPDPIDLQIVVTFKVLCQYFKAQNDGCFVVHQPHGWECWIHTESRIRILVVFFLLNRVISTFADIDCPTVDQYRDLPLCSTKGPWEAKTSAVWASEYAACAHLKDAGLRTIGHMIELQGANRNEAQAQILDSWNAAADNLGVLLNSVTLCLAHA